MPTSAKGWVKPELRVSIMRVKHLKDTGCHAVEVELDGQRPKRTAWVGNTGVLARVKTFGSELFCVDLCNGQMVAMTRSSIERQGSFSRVISRRTTPTSGTKPS